MNVEMAAVKGLASRSHSEKVTDCMWIYTSNNSRRYHSGYRRTPVAHMGVLVYCVRMAPHDGQAVLFIHVRGDI